MKALINLGLMVFLGCSFLIISVYSVGLYEKITKPNFKNLPTSDFHILGLIVFAIIIADYFIIKRFFKTGGDRSK